MLKICISVTSHAFDPPPPVTNWHTFSDPRPHRAWRTLWTAPKEETSVSFKTVVAGDHRAGCTNTWSMLLRGWFSDDEPAPHESQWTGKRVTAERQTLDRRKNTTSRALIFTHSRKSDVSPLGLAFILSSERHPSSHFFKSKLFYCSTATACMRTLRPITFGIFLTNLIAAKQGADQKEPRSH